MRTEDDDSSPRQRARTPRPRRNWATALAVVAICAVAVSSCGDDGSADPAEPAGTTAPATPTVAATSTAPTSPTETTSTSPPETTSAAETTAPNPTPPGAPAAVYTTADPPTDPGGLQTLIDPASGAVLGTEPIDVERSREAQQALPGGVRSTVDLGDVAYAFDQVVYDSGTLDTDIYPDVDLCGQNVVTVHGEAASALPARAHVLSVSPDDQYVVTLSSICPEAGTMGADAVGTQLPFTATFQVFDARQPEAPGQTLLDGVEALNVGLATFSANGRFVALETYEDGSQYHVFDLESGDELDVTEGCSAIGTNHSRFIGPWIGQSSIALMLDCADGQQLLVRDLMPGGSELLVPAPTADPALSARAEVDYAHFDDPETAWFILCDLSQRVCSAGQGDGPLLELSDVSDASFLPLGYYPGN